MLKETAIWLYARGWTTIAILAAAVLALIGGYDAKSKVQLLQSGKPVMGELLELVEKPAEQQAVTTPNKPDQKLQSAARSEAKGDGKEPAAKADPPPCKPVAPKVSYDPGDGRKRIYTSTAYACPTAFAKGKPVFVLVDPSAPDKVMVSATGAWWDHFILAIVLGVAGIVACLIGWFMRPSRDGLARMLVDPALEDSERIPLLPDQAVTHRGSALEGIVATARRIGEGKYPLELCEFAAYMAALAYHEKSKTHDFTLKEYLERNCPHLQYPCEFSAKNTEGFGFVYDGAAFIVMRGTKGWADWRRNLKASTTRPVDFLPPEPGWQHPPKAADWKAPPRHKGFAEGWDVIRDQVEEWVAKTQSKQKMPFIFAGHSLGGALSFLGAWEFATRGREVAAVITFGAAIPGKSQFAQEYEELGLAKRTLRLEFTQDIAPEVQKLIGYKEVGHVWEPERLPLSSQRLALASIPVNWIVGWLQQSLVGDKKAAETNDKAAGADKRQEEKAANAPRASLKERVRAWLFRLVIFLAFSSVLALAAHKMQRRYALALSIMSYRRIRARHATGLRQGEPIDFEACYKQLSDHLKVVRGSTPHEPILFDSIARLPRKIDGPVDLKWLNAFHSARSW